MYTKLLMTLSAMLMAMLGLAASFVPQELLAHYGFGPDRHAALLIQVFGAAYLGFAMLNWMARHNLIGGIYSRPVAMGNMIHFAIAALALVKGAMSGSARTSEMIGAALVYTIFAVWFGLVVFGDPLRSNDAVSN
jgi:hypothetical protein